MEAFTVINDLSSSRAGCSEVKYVFVHSGYWLNELSLFQRQAITMVTRFMLQSSCYWSGAAMNALIAPTFNIAFSSYSNVAITCAYNVAVSCAASALKNSALFPIAACFMSSLMYSAKLGTKPFNAFSKTICLLEFGSGKKYLDRPLQVSFKILYDYFKKRSVSQFTSLSFGSGSQPENTALEFHAGHWPHFWISNRKVNMNKIIPNVIFVLFVTNCYGFAMNGLLCENAIVCSSDSEMSMLSLNYWLKWK